MLYWTYCTIIPACDPKQKGIMENQRDWKEIVAAKKNITEEPNKFLQQAATLKRKLEAKAFAMVKAKLEAKLKAKRKAGILQLK